VEQEYGRTILAAGESMDMQAVYVGPEWFS
jgi:hypothetical protein